MKYKSKKRVVRRERPKKTKRGLSVEDLKTFEHTNEPKPEVKAKEPITEPDKLVTALADSIIQEREEEELKEQEAVPQNVFAQTEEIPEKLEKPEESPSHVFQEAPQPAEVNEAPRPTHIDIGASINNPVIINKYEREIDVFLIKKFGEPDGQFFILGENTQTRTDKHRKRRKFKILNVEDAKGFRYTLWFDLTKTSPLAHLQNH